MNTRRISLAIVFLVLMLCGARTPAQRSQRERPVNPPSTQEQSASLPNNSIDAVANEIDLLHKSLQTLNTRLREISEGLLSTGAKTGEAADNRPNGITVNLALLARVEERAEILRKQLIELIEKETAYRIRMIQLDEDIRPENIERYLSGIGTTRTVELRDTRRRALENERRGLESLLNLTAQSRQRLEEDVKQADALVARLRQKLLPLIDREIEKINPD